MMQVLEGIQARGFAEGYNIIFPEWELPRYPEAWARDLDNFHEVWASSQFCYDSFSAVVKAPIHRVVNACEPYTFAAGEVAFQYMNSDVSFPARFRLIPVQPGEYPEFQNQVWAEPDVVHATELLISLVDDPTLSRSVGERAATHMRRNYSDQVLGARYIRRLRRVMLWPWRRGLRNGGAPRPRRPPARPSERT
jgi:hypothetical protein